MLIVSSTPLIGRRGRYFFSSARKPSNAASSAAGVAVLRRVAAGGVDQHGLVGEPPVAVARAADALHASLAELLGERKVQPGHSAARWSCPSRAAPMKMYQGSEPVASVTRRPIFECVSVHMNRVGDLTEGRLPRPPRSRSDQGREAPGQGRPPRQAVFHCVTARNS